MYFSVTIGTNEQAFINLFFYRFKASCIPFCTNPKVFFFWIEMMKFERAITFVVATNFAFSSLIFNSKVFYLFTPFLNRFNRALLAAIPTIFPKDKIC